MDALLWGKALSEGRLPHEELFFIAYDGLGNPLYSLRFSKLNITGLEQDIFDYESSEASLTEVVVKYEFMQVNCLSSKDKQLTSNYYVKFESPEVQTDFIPIFSNARPTVEIDELKLNLIGGDHWQPSKGKWKPLELWLDTKNLTPVYNLMGSLITVTIQHKIEDHVEQWTLTNAFVSKITSNGKVIIGINKVAYSTEK